MTNRRNDIEDAKDGFDLIEYPCEYVFKAMCKVEGNQDLTGVIRELVLKIVDQDSVLKLNSNSSRTGKFESVSVTVKLLNRDQLEAVYQAIANAPFVVMTL